MIQLIISLLVAFSAVDAQIVADLNCTQYNGTAFVYTPNAVVCNNAISDTACAALYPVAADGDPLPAAGTEAPRPVRCFSADAADADPPSFNADIKKSAVDQCAKHCGFCCQNPEYDCPNKQFPSMNCATITQAQCRDATWRTIIATECPASCGFCNQGGCVDAVVECANDITICNSMNMQDFVNKNCQRTCGRCAGTTSATGGGGCTSYIADSSSSCASWSGNGFCTNDFYTPAQRRSFCATTCRIC